MKVVIFCGGLGLRMGEPSPRVPEADDPCRRAPMLWHIMKYYASFGYSEFVLCLGYKGDVIEEYFMATRGALERLRSRERRSGGRAPPRAQRLVDHLCDTGLERRSASDSRRRAAYRRRRLFLATYGDGLTDAPLVD